MNSSAQTKPTYHLDALTLGPAFETQDANSFIAYVQTLKEIRSMAKVKPPKAPRVKKQILLHSVEESSGICTYCSKKPRNAQAKCPTRGKIIPEVVNSPCEAPIT